ncbi:membrane protein [Herbiconiux moechotypicola]|uniref:Membrane protein n=1 Tax=Herbiconiux moechotypicola TaxID=637393 RepID=A0ABN3DAV0_9MICO
MGRAIGRVALGAGLVFAGVSHLTFARQDFQAQVPDWVPLDRDQVVLASGVAEIALGTALIALPKQKKAVGTVAALFFTAIFPGNVSQWVNERDAFGLDDDRKRFARLFFQPVLIGWALWSTRTKS